MVDLWCNQTIYRHRLIKFSSLKYDFWISDRTQKSFNLYPLSQKEIFSSGFFDSKKNFGKYSYLRNISGGLSIVESLDCQTKMFLQGHLFRNTFYQRIFRGFRLLKIPGVLNHSFKRHFALYQVGSESLALMELARGLLGNKFGPFLNIFWLHWGKVCF